MMATTKQQSARAVFLGHYEALDLLGEGGMGRVYRGRELDSGRPVAIKVMHEEIAAQPRFRQCFEREVRVLAGFIHPHAVALLEASLDDPLRPCLVMEYVPGISLDAMLEQAGPLEPKRVGRLLGQLCWVLQTAHSAGILHRDISGTNLLIVDAGKSLERLKVLDFGLAQLGTGPYLALERLTGSGQNVGPGTPDYLSPEQIQGNEVDHRADLYSVGVVLYKMLTGRLPFGNFTEPADILQAHADQAPPPFATVNPAVRVPAAIERLVLDCLAKDPRERPASARELAQRYQAALGQKFVEWETVTVALPAAPAHQKMQIGRSDILDEMEAWMPEPIAVVKLRGFVHDQGGEVIESVPGLVRVKLPAPAAPAAAPPKRAWPFLGRRPQPPEPRHVLLDLHIEKTDPNQKHLRVTVVWSPEQNGKRIEDDAERAFCEQLCRTLRGYLMSR
jgi:serine/threonine protein kinase